MSYLDDASLVVIPSGYKPSTVFAVKPTDGTGDLTFTRTGDTATRVGPDGLIEKVRTNVVLRSEEQSNAQYTVITNEIASRVAVANPLTGQNNAYKITSTANNDPYIGQVVTGLSNGENTFSLWLWTDAGQSTEATLFFYNQTASEVYTKAITLTTTPTRFDHTVNFSNIGSNATVRVDLRQTGPSIQYIYTYGWQAESGVATAYIATTTAAVSVGPVASVPRLDYLNSSCPRLLLEPQRTNLITFSESFNNAAWTKTAAGTGVTPVVTANSAISPDGYQNADTIVFNVGAGTTSSDQSYINQTLSVTSGSTYSFSVYLKGSVGGEQLIIRSASGSYTLLTLSNEWQRFSVTAAAASTGYAAHFGLRQGVAGTLNSTATVYAYGAQVELGSYVSSYVNTLGAAVTRGADACSKTGISSLIGQTEGTLFAEIEVLSNTDNFGIWLRLSGSLYQNTIIIYTNSSRQPRAEINVGGALQVLITGAALSVGYHKLAFAYKANDFAFYVDGTQIGTSNSGSVPACNDIYIDQYIDGGVRNATKKQALLFKTRLTNAQLAELTTI